MLPKKLRLVVFVASLSLALAPVVRPASAQSWLGDTAVGIQARGSRGALAGARVEILYRGPGGESGGPAPRATNDQGQASFNGLAEGVWSLQVSHPDHLSFVATLSLRRGKKADIVSSFLEASGTGRDPLRVRLFQPGDRLLGAALTVAETPAVDTLVAGASAAEADSAAEPSPAAEPPATESAPAAPPAAAAKVAPSPPTKVTGADPANEEAAAAEDPVAEPAVAEIPAPRRAEAAATADVTPPSPVATPDADAGAAPRPAPASGEGAQAPPEPPSAEAPADEPPPAEPEAAVDEADPEPPATPATPAAPEEGARPTPPAAATAPALTEPPPAAALPGPAAPMVEPPTAPDPAPAEPAAAPPEPEAPAAASAPSALPTPAPAIGQEPAPAPALRGADASARSFRDRTCFECKPGEWAVGASVEVPAGSGCPAGSLDLAASGVELLAAETAADLAAYGGDALAPAVLGRLSAETRRALEDRLGGLLDPASACRVLALALPAGGRMSGFRFEALEDGEGGDCFGDQPCPVGDSRWLAGPGIERGVGATLLWAVFENRSSSRGRLARFVGYFTPPAGWRP